MQSGELGGKTQAENLNQSTTFLHSGHQPALEAETEGLLSSGFLLFLASMVFNMAVRYHADEFIKERRRR